MRSRFYHIVCDNLIPKPTLLNLCCLASEIPIVISRYVTVNDKSGFSQKPYPFGCFYSCRIESYTSNLSRRKLHGIYIFRKWLNDSKFVLNWKGKHSKKMLRYDKRANKWLITWYKPGRGFALCSSNYSLANSHLKNLLSVIVYRDTTGGPSSRYPCFF